MKQCFKYYTCIILTLINLTAHAQTWQWGVRGGGPSNGPGGVFQEKVTDICTDKAGNVYILATIFSSGLPTLSGMSGNVGFTNTGPDLLLASYNCEGVFRWKKTIGGADGEEPLAIGVDTIGNVYITGICRQSTLTPPPFLQVPPVRFDTDSTQPFSNQKWLFLAQYDTSGSLNWIRWPTPDTTSAAVTSQIKYRVTEMVVDKDGSVDMVCTFPKSIIGNAADGEFIADTAGIYILSYNRQGSITRLVKPAFSYSTLNNPAAPGHNGNTNFKMRILKKADGRYIMAGTQIFQSGSPTNDSLVINNTKIGVGSFVACFNADWQHEWTRLGSTLNKLGFNGRPIADNAGSIFLSGSASTTPGSEFNGYFFTNPGYATAVIPYMIKLDADGNNLWVKSGRANGGTTGDAVSMGSNGRVYLAGSYPGTVIFDNYSLQHSVNQGYDIYLASFDAQTGAAMGIDSLASLFGIDDFATAAVCDNKDNVYVGGYFGYNLDIGGTTIYKAGGNYDFFTAKYGTANCSNVVPLKLLSFSAKWLPNNVAACTWATANEVNTKDFIVERSTNGLSFTAAGTLAAHGNGNNTYSFTDVDLPLNNNTVYYRLLMRDKDGQFTYSNVVSLTLPQKTMFIAAPNPATGSTNVLYKTGSSAKKIIKLTDYTGRIVSRYNVSGTIGQLNINTGNIAKGVYFIVLVEGGKTLNTKKLLVQ